MQPTRATVYFDKYDHAVFAVWITETGSFRVKCFELGATNLFASLEDAISWGSRW